MPITLGRLGFEARLPLSLARATFLSAAHKIRLARLHVVSAPYLDEVARFRLELRQQQHGTGADGLAASNDNALAGKVDGASRLFTS